MPYQNWTVTHQSGATATIYAADEADAIDAYRKNYVQPTGTVTAHPQTLQEIRTVDATARQGWVTHSNE